MIIFVIVYVEEITNNMVENWLVELKAFSLWIYI